MLTHIKSSWLREYKWYFRKNKCHPIVVSQTSVTNEKIQFVTEDQVRKEMMNLDGSKATPIGDIYVDI